MTKRSSLLRIVENKASFVYSVREIVSKKLLERMGHQDRHKAFLEWPPASQEAVGALYLKSKQEAAKANRCPRSLYCSEVTCVSVLKEM